MANMGHCRFQNTQADFRDCELALSDEGVDELSDEELRAAKTLLNRARFFLEHAEDIEAAFNERFPALAAKEKAKRSRG